MFGVIDWHNFSDDFGTFLFSLEFSWSLRWLAPPILILDTFFLPLRPNAQAINIFAHKELHMVPYQQLIDNCIIGEF